MRFQLHFSKVSDNLVGDSRVFILCQGMGEVELELLASTAMGEMSSVHEMLKAE